MFSFSDFINLWKTEGALKISFFVIIFLVIIFTRDSLKSFPPIIIDKIARRRKIDFEISKRHLLYIKNFTAQNTSIYCQKRKQIFIDFVSSRIDFFIKAIELMDGDNADNYSGEELDFKIRAIIWGAIFESNKELLEKQMPQNIVEKISSIETDEIKMLDRLISQVCLSRHIYRSNKEKIMVILDFLCVIGDAVMTSAEITVDKLNGEITGIVYKGLSCDTCTRIDCKNKKEKI